MEAAVKSILEAGVKNGAAPNIQAAVAKDGKIILNLAAGTTNADGTGSVVKPDTPVRIMSMTKFMTSVALLQYVEQGKVNVDAPLASILPEFKDLKMLVGFEEDGKPKEVPAPRQPTVREVMTHSSGFTYEFLDPDLAKYCAATGLPSIFLQKKAGIHGQPLMFEPGTQWVYGTNIDIGGFIVEHLSGMKLSEYLKKHIFEPLGMKNTFMGQHEDTHEHHVPVHLRQPDEAGTLVHLPMPPPAEADFEMGGGGLTSTMSDYLVFLNDMLSATPKTLKKSTIDTYVNKNNLADGIWVQVLKAAYPYADERSFIPGSKVGHSMACAINEEAVPGMRAKGSMAWAGLLNSYCWADPVNNVSGVIATQVLPFADRKIVPLFEEFERAVYANM